MSNADDPRGKFVWHELLTADAAGADAFYPKVVSWKPQAWENDSSYTLWMGKGGPMGGAMSMPADADGPAHWLGYIGVEDIHASIAQAKSLGAKVIKDVTDLPTVGTFAVLADPQGAEFGVLKSANEYKGASADAGEFSWHELSTSDADAAMRFYTRLFGWQMGGKHDMGPMGFYHLFNQDGKQYGGMFKSPHGDPPAWVLYVRVDDVGKAAEAVKNAGGRVLNGPMEVPGGTWVAQVMDPEGVMFALHEDRRVAAAQSAPASKPATAAKPKEAKPAAAAPPPAQGAAKPVKDTVPSKPAVVAKPKPAASVKPAAAPATPASKPAAAKPAVNSARSSKARTKVVAKAKPAAKKAAKKSARKTTTRIAGKKVARKAAKKAAGKVARKAAGKKKSAVKRAPAKKKASAAKRSAARKGRAKAKKHR